MKPTTGKLLPIVFTCEFIIAILLLPARTTVDTAIHRYPLVYYLFCTIFFYIFIQYFLFIPATRLRGYLPIELVASFVGFDCLWRIWMDVDKILDFLWRSLPQCRIFLVFCYLTFCNYLLYSTKALASPETETETCSCLAKGNIC